MITVSKVLVIGADGEKLGVVDTDSALAMAEEEGLDLVEVSPNVSPPVCKILDYGKPVSYTHLTLPTNGCV